MISPPLKPNLKPIRNRFQLQTYSALQKYFVMRQTAGLFKSGSHDTRRRPYQKRSIGTLSPPSSDLNGCVSI